MVFLAAAFFAGRLRAVALRAVVFLAAAFFAGRLRAVVFFATATVPPDMSLPALWRVRYAQLCQKNSEFLLSIGVSHA